MAKKEVAVKKPMTKSEIIGTIADSTGLTKRNVGSVLDELNGIIARHIKKRGVGSFVLPGMIKIEAQKVPARKEQQKTNPFKPGEMMTVKARPASMKVKVRALKGLKEMAAV